MIADANSLAHAGKFTTGDGCWMWTASTERQGYGHVNIAGRTVGAHRYVYEALVGPIPPGMDLDHICHNEDETCDGGWTCPHRRYVRPDHLEPTDQGTNLRRGKGLAATKAAQTHCIHGHAFDEQNTKVRANGTRSCRMCHAQREARRRAA